MESYLGVHPRNWNVRLLDHYWRPKRAITVYKASLERFALRLDEVLARHCLAKEIQDNLRMVPLVNATQPVYLS